MTRASLSLSVALSLALLGCGSDGDDGGANTGGGGGAGGSSSGGASNGGTSGTGGSGTGGSATGGSGGAGATGGSGGGGPGGIGEWTDAPGACPSGAPQVAISTSADLAAATRGEGSFAGDAPDTCYLIANGDYEEGDVIVYVKVGGTASQKRMFVGESRTGVVIHGRATIDDGVSDVTLANLTFDLTGYVKSGSFNTLSIGNGSGITVDHVTFTGDCNTGVKGGHIETNGSDGVLIDSCLIEKFGHCGPAGHEDHGVYLASGKNITLRNNVIRGNASRGVQLYTANGDYGTLDHITIEYNRIYENGHANYEDGIVINGADTGTIDTVNVRRNLIYGNFYSGIRFVGGAMSNVSIAFNTFSRNGAGSEIAIDDQGGAAGTVIENDIFDVETALLNDCYDASSLGFSIGANFVNGSVPNGDCVAAQTTGDPEFVDAAAGDYHPGNGAAQAFGAYAP